MFKINLNSKDFKDLFKVFKEKLKTFNIYTDFKDSESIKQALIKFLKEGKC
ncbi:hypothetical protein Emin_1083 [Elusimicrobium minutum Pei191]|uniref:Uncharacterized protein n=1 Tax=Elusimicrobium minutum (strain Pei191) TaxID=445932 RepID=B2KDN9_ELUMP|nr:hypothetical protein Emin_1083 [Elusimicrobium minutum Pei191]